MPKPVTGYKGAIIRIEGLLDVRPFLYRVAKFARTTPNWTRKAVGKTAAWWHAQAVPRVPIRASRRKQPTGKAFARGRRFSRVGRGRLRQSVQPWVESSLTHAEGGLRADASYAIWLAAGTRRIAKGRVMKWKPGDPLIRSWPAKRQGGNPRGTMPILLPWFQAAHDDLVKRLTAMMEKA